MSNSFGVIPLDNRQSAQEAIAWLQDKMILFVPETYPQGRVPTRIEFKKAITELGYTLEHSADKYPATKIDFTPFLEVLPIRQSSQPDIIWFEYGNILLIDLIQQLANSCGSFLIVDGSGGTQILIVPDRVFNVPVVSNQAKEVARGYVATMVKRMPYIIEQLKNATSIEARFLLSQIRQAIVCTYGDDTYAISQSAREGLFVYEEYLQHADAEIRLLAHDLITLFRQDFYSSMPKLQQAIIDEENANIKVHKIWALESHIKSTQNVGRFLNEHTLSFINSLSIITTDTEEPLPVRLAAANLLVRTQPGFYNQTIHKLFVNALINPTDYTLADNTPSKCIYQILDSVKTMLWHHRINILREALPNMRFASDAHEVMRAILDNLFFGEVRDSWRSGLPPTQVAERPQLDESRFREHDNRSWLYQSNPTKIDVVELQPYQIDILREVLTIEIPWMVHSNVLQKYGLPVSRSEVVKMLENSQT